ncbi:MAG: hypothetical protein KKC80_07275 [Candidatus Margulisbacteria bacterium]|nr:hypothetical protein [Candidatus Margulisiibacteriota bacterium]MBU1616958.1 hypothetical protein [Candidatus Margulisiibacteriota bacterium]
MRTALERLLHIQSGTADTFFAQFGSNETPIKNAISSLYGSSSTEKMREAWTLDRFVGLYVDVLDHREERSEKQKADTVIPIYTAIFAARLQDAAQPPATPENSTSLAPSTSEQFFGSFPFGDTLKTYISGLYGPAAEQKMSELWTIDRFTGLYSDLVRNQNNPADKAKIAATLPLMRQGLFQLLVKAQPAAGQPAPTEPNPAIAQITPLLKVGEFDAPTFQAVVTNTIVALTTEHKKDGTPPFDANKIKADPRYKALQALMGTDSFMNPDFAREGNPVRTIIAGWKDNTEIGRGCIAILTTLYSTTAGQPSIIDTTANPTMVADLGIMTNNAASDAALINAASGVTAPTETPAATTAPAPGTAIPQGTFIRTDVSGTTYARSGEKFFKVTENKWEEEYTPGAPKPTTPCNSHTNPIRVTYINGQRYFVARADNGRDYVINDNQWTNSRVELRQPTADLDAGADASLAPIIITE